MLNSFVLYECNMLFALNCVSSFVCRLCSNFASNSYHIVSRCALRTSYVVTPYLMHLRVHLLLLLLSLSVSTYVRTVSLLVRKTLLRDCSSQSALFLLIGAKTLLERHNRSDKVQSLVSIHDGNRCCCWQ